MKSDREEKLKDERKVCEFCAQRSKAFWSSALTLLFALNFLILECCQFDWKQTAIQFAFFFLLVIWNQTAVSSSIFNTSFHFPHNTYSTFSLCFNLLAPELFVLNFSTLCI